MNRNPTAMTVTRDLVDYHHRTEDDPAECEAWDSTLNQWPGLRHLIEKAAKVRERVEDSVHTPGPVGPDPDVDPAYSAGRVDFSEMLTQDWQWSIKHRLDALLGRPYTSTQVAALLPADVALRLTDRIEHVIEERVRAEIDRIQDDITNATAETLARMAASADEKLKELRNERYKPTRLS
ncbi:MAG: hypothetical protein HOV78_05070 [Hamadaea sp.]|nr:hypothetical protein [Hamadaea sp.]